MVKPKQNLPLKQKKTSWPESRQALEIKKAA